MTLFDYVKDGGFIMYLLLVFNIFGLTILLSKAFYFLQFLKNINQHAAVLLKDFQSKTQALSLSTEGQISLLKEEIAVFVRSMETWLGTVKIIATISPLLGLLGTVVGILLAFQVISQQGLGDPSLFAKGISMALITTVGGLVVAIPHYIGHNYLVGLLDKIETQLEKEILMKSFAGKKSEA